MTTTITNGILTAAFNHTGAELISLRTAVAELIWEGNPEWWGKHSPVLFPIVGSLKDNTYHHRGKNYSMNRHGFAREKNFNLLSHSDTTAVFSLLYDQETLDIYPFKFELRILYSLEGNRINVSFQVSNLGAETMYFSIGAHPAFALPHSLDQYEILLSEPENPVYNTLDNGLLSATCKILPTGRGKFKLDYGLFANDALVFKSISSKSLTILHNEQPYIGINYAGFPDLGLWTKPGAGFICVEPWFGYSDTTHSSGLLSEKESITRLNPSARFESAYSIIIPTS